MSALQNSEIVPDVVDSVELDTAVEFAVKFPSGIAIANGNDVPKEQSQDVPQVDIKGSGLYTLIVTDPDAPSREDPKWGEFLHWMVVNIKDGNLTSGEEVVSYMGPAPPPGTGKHRYIFLLYRQTSPGELGQLAKEDVDKTLKVSAPEERKQWSARKWQQENNLRVPCAVRFFYTEVPAQ